MYPATMQHLPRLDWEMEGSKQNVIASKKANSEDISLNSS